MESKFKSLTLFEFQEQFPDEDSCYKYLANLKWSEGYKCTKCGHGNYCAGISPYSRQCTSCRYIESATAGTLFHKCKFSILLAFYIVYYVATSKKGIASTELSRKLGLRQKTCWTFKRKVMQGMSSSKKNRIKGKVDVDETYVGGQDEKAIGRNEGKKKIVVVAVERKKRGISRFYGRVIETASKANLKGFMDDFIDKEAEVRTDKWSGYRGLDAHYKNLSMEKSEKKGRNFHELHRTIMMFKAWLRGVHHHVKHLQAYIDEYSFRFNRHNMTTGIFENLMGRMVAAEPYPVKMFLN